MLYTRIFFQCIWKVCVWFLSFSEDGMEVMERLIYLFRKFHQLKISNEEYACMKAINFLNQGNNTSSSIITKSSMISALPVFTAWLCLFICIAADIRGLSNTSQLEQLNKRYWYVCQDYTEYKYPHQPKRFPEIMMCLPEIRCIAGKASKYWAVHWALHFWWNPTFFCCMVDNSFFCVCWVTVELNRHFLHWFHSEPFQQLSENGISENSRVVYMTWLTTWTLMEIV